MSTWLLLRTIGRDATLELQRRYGGRKLYVRASPGPDDPLAQVIGLEAAQALAREAGSTALHIGRHLVWSERNARIQRLAGDRCDTRTIAEATGIGPRWVRKILEPTKGALARMIQAPTFEALRAAVENKGYRWFEGGSYNLNLIGIRAASREAGAFDDRFVIAFRHAEQAIVLDFACTTDPGRSYLRDPINAAGCAILKPGQYKGLWQIGQHRGKYAALVQRGPAIVYRDNNRDDRLDDGPAEDVGYFGINLHHARADGTTESPDEWSAGCQVMRDADEFRLVVSLAEVAAERWGNSFTYTLLEETDL